MKQVMMLIAVLAVAPAVAGQDADDYRGGWRTDSGEAHVYEFSIRGTTVRGVYCTYCADATTLAFIHCRMLLQCSGRSPSGSMITTRATLTQGSE